MNNRLKVAIEAKDVNRIKTILSTSLTTNPADSSGNLKQALQEVETKEFDVWEAHDGRELLEEKTQWTKDYFSTLQSQLISNFSKERFERAMVVGRNAYEDELNRPQANATTEQYVGSAPEKSGTDTRNFIVAGVVIIALATAVYMITK